MFERVDERRFQIQLDKPLILRQMERPVLLCEIVVKGVQALAGVLDLLFGRAVLLEVEQGPRRVAERENVVGLRERVFGNVRRFRKVFAVVPVDFAVLADEAADFALCGGFAHFGFQFFPRPRRRIVHAPRDG